MLSLIVLLGIAYQTTNAQTTSEEFDERFHSKLYSYIFNGEIEFRIREALILVPEAKVEEMTEIDDEPAWEIEDSLKTFVPLNPILKVTVNACRHKDKSVLKIAPWMDFREYLLFRKKDRVLRPLVYKATIDGEDCLKVGSIKSRKSNIKSKSINLSIVKLLSGTKKWINVNDPGTYLRIDVHQSIFPFLKRLGSERIDSHKFLKDLVLNKSEVDVDLFNFKDVQLSVGLKMRFGGSQNYPIKDLLTKNISHPLFLLDVLGRSKELEPLLYSDSGVWERYTIKEHSLRVLELLKEQYSCLVKPEFEKEMSENLKMPLKNFMELTMSLHDIGKPLALEAGDKDRQHEFTRPVMEKVMKVLRVPEDARTIALELTDNDVIGDYLKGSISFTQAVSQLEAQAKKTVLSVENYFKLQMMFYTADAGSYPGLFERVFTEDANCCIKPKSSRYKILESKILNNL